MIGPMLAMFVLGLLAGACLGLLLGISLCDRYPYTHSEHDRATATGQRGHGGQHPRGGESTERNLRPPPTGRSGAGGRRPDLPPRGLEN